MCGIVDSVVGGCISAIFIALAVVIGCIALGMLGSFVFAVREAWWDWQERRKEHEIRSEQVER